jgi:hypothetical protein
MMSGASSGASCENVREHVLYALHLMLAPDPAASGDPDREPLELPLAS